MTSMARNGTTETQLELNLRIANAFLPVTVTFGIFAVIGVVGNVFVILVFFLGYYKKSSYSVFVICMGIIDLLTSALFMPAEVIKHRHYVMFESMHLCKVNCYFQLMFVYAANMCLLLICVDRFKKVVHPLKSQVTPTCAAWLCIALSFITSAILSVPEAYLCNVLQLNITNIYNTSTEVNVCAIDPKYDGSSLKIITAILTSSVLGSTAFVCFVMYTMIGRKIYKQIGSVTSFTALWRLNTVDLSIHSTDNSRSAVRRFPYKALIWFILTMLFIMTYICYSIFVVHLLYFEDSSPQTLSIVVFFLRIYFINSIANPIIYTLLDRKFRQASRDMIREIFQKSCVL